MSGDPFLYIDFTGIAAFVPRRGGFRVVFPAVVDAVCVHHVAIPPHALSVSYGVDQTYISLAKRKPNFTVIRREVSAPDRYVFLIEGEHMTLDAQTGGETTVNINPARIVDMAKVNDKGRFDDGAASELFDPDPSRIAGWFDIEYGDLAADGSETAMIEFQPHTGPAAYRDRFAEKVTLKLQPDRYALYGRPFGSKPGPGPKILDIDATKGEVRFEIGNYPYEDLVFPDSERVKNRDFDVLDHHFHLFYGLCCDELDVHPLPKRVSALSFPHRAAGVNCPPALFSK